VACNRQLGSALRARAGESVPGPNFVIGTVLLAVTLSALGTDAQTRVAANEPRAASAHAGIQADPEKIRAHVKYLASDTLEGRGTGQRGGDMAADYIAKQFASYGLRPGGDNGTYFQDIPMMEVTTLGETSFNVVSANLETTTLKNLEDFVTSNESQTESAYIDAPIVFVGYGIKAPEYDWDDYKETRLDGKVALLFANEPASDDPKFFKGKALTYYGGWTYKLEETARRGAIATLIIHRTDLASDSWQVVRNSWGRQRSYLPRDGTPKLRAASWIRSEAAKKLASMAGLDLDRLFEQAQSKDFRPIELPLRLQAHVASGLRPFVARNVLAVLPAAGGVSPQAVLYTAHYDHLGIDPELKGHNIYNGAVDSATGCGVLLEIARVWSGTPSAPPRMILFAALTGEDQGLLGSEYLGKHSPVPPGKISLDMNYDALAPIGDPEEVVVSGAERTTFYSAVEAQAKALMLAIAPDPRPEAGTYYRSSPFSLARAGIPAFSIAEGWKFKGHDAAWGEAQRRDYMEHRYRQPTDQYLPGMDFTGDARLAMLGYQLGLQASSQPELIGWVPGDEFEPERKRSQRLDEMKLRAPPRKLKPYKK
jgi:Zn-dependent M28 family amino/carboxypeptidase